MRPWPDVTIHTLPPLTERFHMEQSRQQLDAQLVSLLRDLGLDVPPLPARVNMIDYLLEILAVNERINLTNITEPEAALRLHIVDSLTALPELAGSPVGPALDIGSGGGFPGVPLAIASGRPFTLLDSVAKKGCAVRDVLENLSPYALDIEVLSARAEQQAIPDRGQFSAVVARAVAPLPSLVELASPFLQPGGLLIALKGRPDSSERGSGAAVARMVGMAEQSWRELSLPRGGERRTVVAYIKERRSTVDLPRRAGLAQHSPLS